jgi:hypothetical protein
MRGHNNSTSGTSKVSQKNQNISNNNNVEGTILLPKSAKDVTSAQDTIYLCNFRVSVDGEWLCLKELQDGMQNSTIEGGAPNDVPKKSRVANEKCNEKIVERDWVNYYCRCFLFSFEQLFFVEISFPSTLHIQTSHMTKH